MNLFFFTGKGGTGKTFLSSSISLLLSENKFNTLLISLDPAHNISDTFDINIFSNLTNINDHLKAIELDIDKIINDYFNLQLEKIKKIFKSLSVTNTDNYIDILKFSPGLEEYAIIEVINNYIKSNEYDFVVFDMPPTGLSLRVFSLPEITLKWTENLINLRKKIFNRKKMINKIENFFIENCDDDPILSELYIYNEEIIKIRKAFLSDKCKIFVITNPEKVALSETLKIMNYLKKFNLSISCIIINKIFRLNTIPEELKSFIYEQDYIIEKFKNNFKNIDFIEIPFIGNTIRGIESLRDFTENYLKKYIYFFVDL